MSRRLRALEFSLCVIAVPITFACSVWSARLLIGLMSQVASAEGCFAPY